MPGGSCVIIIGIEVREDRFPLLTRTLRHSFARRPRRDNGTVPTPKLLVVMHGVAPAASTHSMDALRFHFRRQWIAFALTHRVAPPQTGFMRLATKLKVIGPIRSLSNETFDLRQCFSRQ